MKVCFRKIYSIYGEIDTEEVKFFSFELALKHHHNAKLRLHLNLEKNILEASTLLTVSPQLQVLLENEQIILRELNEELISISKEIHENAHKFMRYLKYSLNQHSLDEILISLPKNFEYSLDESDWKNILIGGTLYPDQNFGVCKLNQRVLEQIEIYFKEDYEPLLAMKHLHRAKKENTPRYKWIEATIALELAIKEVLIRKNPDVQLLLLELPSPPLDKLYNQIFSHYFDKEIPKKMRKIVTDGAKIRNRLLHRPEEFTIDLQEAINYVFKSEELIFYVLGILYPEDCIVSKLNTPEERGTSDITIHRGIN